MNGDGASERPGRDLFELLLKDVDALTTRVIGGLQQLPSYASVPIEALRPGATVGVRAILSAARDRRTRTSDEERRALAEQGEMRAHQGVPVEDLLRGWRIAIDHAWSDLRTAGEGVGLSDTDLLADLQAIITFTDEAMIVSSGGHRRAELELARQEHDRRAGFVRAVLFGSLAPTDLQPQASAYGLDPTRQYHAVRARGSDSLNPRHLEGALGLPAAGPDLPGMVATIEGDIAGFVTHVPDPELTHPIGVGSKGRLDSLGASFLLATRALSTATAFGLRGVIHFVDLGIRPAIVAEDQLGDRLVARYIEPLASHSNPPEVLVDTAEAFLECGMRVGRTASRLHVHPNTLRYRLGRIDKLIGVSFQDPAQTCELWWALQRAKLQHRDPEPE